MIFIAELIITFMLETGKKMGVDTENYEPSGFFPPCAYKARGGTSFHFS